MSAKRELWVIEKGSLGDWEFFACYDEQSNALDRMRDMIYDGFEPERVRMVRYVPEGDSK
ncbi:MAG: hypothetical protein ACK52I_02360 [Pseudomonadota bacterium]|jgi:hypothetical protein